MTLKQYQVLRMAVAVILGVIFSQTIIFQNYLVPIVAVTVAMLVLILAKKKVKGVIADERDYAVGGKAALLTIQIYSWIAVVIMFFLYTKRELYPSYEAIAITLAYSTCLLMIGYGLIFRYYNKIAFLDKKMIYTVLFIVAFVAVVIFGLRLLSGEDDWICSNGQWIKHGQPDFPAPTVECK